MNDLFEEIRLRVLNGSDDDGHGRMCRFFNIDGRGVKTYRHFDQCQDAFAVQRCLSDYGVTPQVKSDIVELRQVLTDWEGEWRSGWCFETEVIDQLLTSDEYDNDTYAEEIDEMRALLWATGWYDPDSCWFNLGFLNDAIVLVDTGATTKYNEKQARRGLVNLGILKPSKVKPISKWLCPCSNSDCVRERENA